MTISRKKRIESWKANNDPIKIELYNILVFVKILVCLLIIYIFVLSFSEIIFTFENATDNALGNNHKPLIREKANAIQNEQRFGNSGIHRT